MKTYKNTKHIIDKANKNIYYINQIETYENKYKHVATYKTYKIK